MTPSNLLHHLTGTAVRGLGRVRGLLAGPARPEAPRGSDASRRDAPSAALGATPSATPPAGAVRDRGAAPSPREVAQRAAHGVPTSRASRATDVGATGRGRQSTPSARLPTQRRGPVS